MCADIFCKTVFLPRVEQSLTQLTLWPIIAGNIGNEAKVSVSLQIQTQSIQTKCFQLVCTSETVYSARVEKDDPFPSLVKFHKKQWVSSRFQCFLTDFSSIYFKNLVLASLQILFAKPCFQPELRKT